MTVVSYNFWFRLFNLTIFASFHLYASLNMDGSPQTPEVLRLRWTPPPPQGMGREGHFSNCSGTIEENGWKSSQFAVTKTGRRRRPFRGWKEPREFRSDSWLCWFPLRVTRETLHNRIIVRNLSVRKGGLRGPGKQLQCGWLCVMPITRADQIAREITWLSANRVGGCKLSTKSWTRTNKQAPVHGLHS